MIHNPCKFYGSQALLCQNDMHITCNTLNYKLQLFEQVLGFMEEMLMFAELTCHTVLADMTSVNLQQNLPQPHPDRTHPCQQTNVN